MALRGNLRDFTITQLLNLINLAVKTGTLVVEGPSETARIAFRDGKLAYAELGPKMVVSPPSCIMPRNSPLANTNPSGRTLPTFPTRNWACCLLTPVTFPRMIFSPICSSILRILSNDCSLGWKAFFILIIISSHLRTVSASGWILKT